MIHDSRAASPRATPKPTVTACTPIVWSHSKIAACCATAISLSRSPRPDDSSISLARGTWPSSSARAFAHHCGNLRGEADDLLDREVPKNATKTPSGTRADRKTAATAAGTGSRPGPRSQS